MATQIEREYATMSIKQRVTVAEEALIKKNYNSPLEIRKLIEESSLDPNCTIEFGVNPTVFYCASFDSKVESVLQSMIEEQIQA